MSVLQSKQRELRYLRRENLEEEARIMGGWYRDCIRQYGIDCVYHKLKLDDFKTFKNVVDQNVVLKRAYGCDIQPEYHPSAEMIAFAEFDSDIFQLNKYGIQPQTDINLYFDSVQFACDMATKIGRFREYKIKEREIVCEIPECGENDDWSYELDTGYTEIYECDMLSGRYRCVIPKYELDEEQTVACDPYEHTDFDVSFAQNGDLYKSLKYEIENDDYLETMIFVTFKVRKIKVCENDFKFVLTGRLHGSVLFFDLNELGKYTELIHPEIGDVVEIDFPDENNREKYEITECFDKQLTPDGVNPLLHKYVWKCKARRHVQGEEIAGLEKTEADRRHEEKLKYEKNVDEAVAAEISLYDTIDEERGIKEDAVYGGYENVADEFYDNRVAFKNHEKYIELSGDEEAAVHVFGCGSSLRTNGYDLFFDAKDGTRTVMATYADEKPLDAALFERGTRWIKASDSQIVFVDREGGSQTLAYDDGTLEINLESLYDCTVDEERINDVGDDFLKFAGTKTLMWATSSGLYAKLASDGKTRKLV